MRACMRFGTKSWFVISGVVSPFEGPGKFSVMDGVKVIFRLQYSFSYY